MVVFFPLMSHGGNGDGARVIDLEQRDVTRMTEWNQQLSPSRVFLHQGFSAREWRIGKKCQAMFDGREGPSCDLQIALQQKSVQSV
jgi:hypothetical protein